MEEVSKFRNKVRQVRQKRDKREESTKIDLHKSDKRHKLDKHQPLPKGLWYERYTLLTSNHTTILEEAFNLEVLIRLPPTKPPRLGDFKGINPMVVSIIITNFMVSKVLIDQGNSTDILYWRTFHRLEVSPDIVHPHAGPLLGFVGKIVETRDYVDLMTTFGQRQLSRSLTIRFLLVDVDTSYFGLIAPYPPTRKSAKPHRTTIEGTQVMSMDEGSPIRALTVHQASLDDEFDIDPREDTSGKGPKSIKELVKL
ncbi:hypothetical protein JHK87_039933 [Glycine soja]|nr:hypothetical protein JHK87_039933 [Glycine soja]